MAKQSTNTAVVAAAAVEALAVVLGRLTKCVEKLDVLTVPAGGLRVSDLDVCSVAKRLHAVRSEIDLALSQYHREHPATPPVSAPAPSVERVTAEAPPTTVTPPVKDGRVYRLTSKAFTMREVTGLLAAMETARKLAAEHGEKVKVYGDHGGSKPVAVTVSADEPEPKPAPAPSEELVEEPSEESAPEPTPEPTPEPKQTPKPTGRYSVHCNGGEPVVTGEHLADALSTAKTMAKTTGKPAEIRLNGAVVQTVATPKTKAPQENTQAASASPKSTPALPTGPLGHKEVMGLGKDVVHALAAKLGVKPEDHGSFPGLCSAVSKATGFAPPAKVEKALSLTKGQQKLLASCEEHAKVNPEFALELASILDRLTAPPAKLAA